MVDLAEIRKRAKEKKEAEASAPDLPAAEPPTPEAIAPPRAEIPVSVSEPKKPKAKREARPAPPAVTPEPLAAEEAPPAIGFAPEGVSPEIAPAEAAPPAPAVEPEPEGEIVLYRPAPAPVPAPVAAAEPSLPEAAPQAAPVPPPSPALPPAPPPAPAVVAAPDVATPTGETPREYLTFSLGGEEYAMPIDRIVEIVPHRPTTPVPNADDSVLGILSLRGVVVPVLDIRTRLGGREIPVTHDTRFVVLALEKEMVGLFVDRVRRVIRLVPSEVQPPPRIGSAEGSDSVAGVVERAGRIVVVLDLDRLLEIAPVEEAR